jgi:hypothetical protein
VIEDPAAASRAWTEEVVRQRLAHDASKAVNNLDRAAGQAAALLDDPRMALPALAGMRARLLSACLAAGAVAIGRDD